MTFLNSDFFKIRKLIGKDRTKIMKLFQKLSKQKGEFITVVSGLPRSGTSMMMKMLEAGGILPLTDKIRAADDDNPQGYYEFERVKKMPDGDFDWLPKAQGKSVKVIAALLEYLPSSYNYKVLFMRRSMDEIMASQKQMLIRSDKLTDEISDEKLAELFQKHLAKVESWMSQQPHLSVLDVDYNDLMKNPGQYPEKIQEFLGVELDLNKMEGVIDPALYRQRKA
jgi:hypothetical protein